MYRYDEFDQHFVDERVAQFRYQTQRYIDGTLSHADFLHLRLRNGLYIQRLAPMLRIAVPYGTLASHQLRMLAHIARYYDRGYGHLSTRQNMQFNWPDLAEVPDILADLATVQMHAIQTSGNCIRNVTADQVDGRPYCELIRQWSTAHPEFDWLPRKFKIAINGSASDRAAIDIHDIGLEARRDASGQVVFDVKVGGGLGRTPILGSLIRESLPDVHLLTYLESILRVYNRYGRRDNKHKARIKILVRAMSPEVFRHHVEAEWVHSKDGPTTLTRDEIDRTIAAFAPPPYERLESDDSLAAARLAEPEFSRWVHTNVAPHKRAGYAIVTLSTKVTGVAPGDVTDVQMDAVADWADRFGFGEIRISHEQNFVLPDVRERDLLTLWQLARSQRLASANLAKLTDIICCPGGDYCSLANAKSLPIAEAIQQRFDDADYLYDLGDINLNISGCMNACGHHHVGHIGILGVDKKGEEWYQISLGGSAGRDSSLAEIIGPSFARGSVPDVIEQILEVYVAKREHDERFLDCYRRIGIEPFKERVYSNTH
jgi:sulfite reductase (NADPH) hemoprotein beta-component